MNHPRMEMHVVSFLEMIGIPFTGSGSKCLAFTYDKQAILNIAESIGIPIPKTVFVEDDSQILNHGLVYPVILKPNSTDGSFGLTKKNIAKNDEDLLLALDSVRREFKLEGTLLIQEYLEGPDLNVGLMGNGPRVLPITQEDYSALPADFPKICGFESKVKHHANQKWIETSPYWNIKTIPTQISPEKQKLVADYSTALFKRIGCRDYARFDWRLDSNGNPRLIEANPNCGWCHDGHLAKTAQLAGIAHIDMLKMILESALERYKSVKSYDLTNSSDYMFYITRVAK